MLSTVGLTSHLLLFLCFIYHGIFSSPVQNSGSATYDPFQFHQKRCTDCDDDYSEYWELQSRVNLSGVLPVLKYKSRRTGLTVVLAQADSPIVNGYFCLATEDWTNEGLPHTLEHLIFLGSEDYPYKEVLDLMANRCLADRTNAWTDTDHTCYTVYTAGSSGFLNILPIYMDHILYPTLRDQDFLTEVHHVNGDGEDAGVVYSEMQGVENKASNIIYFDLIKQVYPGNSSYTVQTGGKLKDLRESTTIEKVRAYHKKYYRPDNMFLTITGNVDPQNLFAALEPIEQKILDHIDEYPDFERPFTSPLETIEKETTRTIEYPSDEEEFGWIAIGWRIPGKLVDNYKQIHSLSILGSYLSSTSISPLKKAFVDIPEPLATDVDIDILMNVEAAVTIDFENVPIDKMDDIEKKFKETIEQVHKDGIDMERLHTIIKRKVLTRKMNLENSPHLVIPDPAVLDMLYGTKKDQIYQFIRENEEDAAQDLMAKPDTYWLDMMNVTFSRPRVMTKAYPSQKFGKDLISDENKRVEAQIEKLGPEGLEKAANSISEAIKSQILPPPEVLKTVPVADVDFIKFRKMNYFNHSTVDQPTGFKLSDIPFSFQFDDVNSQFVRIYLFIDTSNIPYEDRLYLVLLTELWMISPIRNQTSNQIEPYESVLQRRSNIALSLYNDLGYKGSTFSPGSHSDLMMFFAEAELANYEKTIGLLREAIFNVEFSLEKARILISQLLNGIPSMKLSASSMNSALFDNLFFGKKNNNIYFTSVLRQQQFLEKISNQLQDNPVELISKLHQLKDLIVQPRNIFVQMATSLNRLTESYPKSTEPWINLFGSSNSAGGAPSFSLAQLKEKRFTSKSDHHFKNPKPEMRHAMIGIPGTSSCYLKQSIPYEITDWEAQEVATMRVMLQYLSDRMYDQIRGKGLTYGVSMSSSVTEGRTRVSFSRSSQLTEAYAKFRQIIRNYTNPDSTTTSGSENNPWNEDYIESAKGSQIYDWAEREETIEDLGSSSVKASLRQTSDPFYNRRFVKRLANVTLNDVKELALKYLPLFEDANQTLTAITCGPQDIEHVVDNFKQYDISLEVIDMDENNILTE